MLQVAFGNDKNGAQRGEHSTFGGAFEDGKVNALQERKSAEVREHLEEYKLVPTKQVGTNSGVAPLLNFSSSYILADEPSSVLRF